ncbi:MAG: NUDIX domain-containing protein [Aquitalea sp.]|nr:NUDIX domain-containing protein [Aquitalea sp.]
MSRSQWPSLTALAARVSKWVAAWRSPVLLSVAGQPEAAGTGHAPADGVGGSLPAGQRGPRASVVVIQDGRLLMMQRIKNGKEYFVLPGGTIKAGETPAMACVRETREETGLNIWLAEQLCQLEHKGRPEYVFLASKFRGTLQLGGPERERMTADNQYHLVWLDYAQLQRVKLRPKNLLIHCQEWLWPVNE